MNKMNKCLAMVLSVASLAVFSGCAGSAPTAEFKKPINDSMRLCSTDEATVKVVAADGVTLSDANRQRLEARLVQALNEKKKSVQCQTQDKRAFVLNSKITTYEEGNAFARFMLAGLGQIHIDGDFALNAVPAKDSLAEFTVQKTFAFGGIYGAKTHIEDIEPAFAEGVAEAIVAKNPGSASAK